MLKDTIWMLWSDFCNSQNFGKFCSLWKPNKLLPLLSQWSLLMATNIHTSYLSFKLRP